MRLCSWTTTCIFSLSRPSMSHPHLVKKGREHRKIELQRDFTVASPAEFVTRFGGNRVIDKVRYPSLSVCAFFGCVSLNVCLS